MNLHIITNINKLIEKFLYQNINFFAFFDSFALFEFFKQIRMDELDSLL